jgi:hypothetical protein
LASEQKYHAWVIETCTTVDATPQRLCGLRVQSA